MKLNLEASHAKIGEVERNVESLMKALKSPISYNTKPTKPINISDSWTYRDLASPPRLTEHRRKDWVKDNRLFDATVKENRIWISQYEKDYKNLI
jgi:hypothetical protein